jgi:hypothetical protein
VLLARVQEGLGGLKQFRRESGRFQQTLHGDSIRFVVIDNGNDLLLPLASHTGSGWSRAPQERNY